MLPNITHLIRINNLCILSVTLFSSALTSNLFWYYLVFVFQFQFTSETAVPLTLRLCIDLLSNKYLSCVYTYKTVVCVAKTNQCQRTVLWKMFYKINYNLYTECIYILCNGMSTRISVASSIRDYDVKLIDVFTTVNRQSE